MIRIRRKKLWASCFCIVTCFFLLVTLQVVVELGKSERKEIILSSLQDGPLKLEEQKKQAYQFLKKQELFSDVKTAVAVDQYPILLWWSPLTGETGRLGECGEDLCFFTINRTYQHNHMTRAFLFYGTDFNIESLPLPRKGHHDWALFHEESPKNNYKLFHKPTITLFNHTATFSRHSHLPLTTQYLEGIEVLKSLRYMIPLQKKNSLRKRLAPLVYVQSDCDPPSDRDSYVSELMSYIEVDSYGECLHNRDLPQHLKNPASMDDGSFYTLLAQYKFILAFENAVCEDYITEKLWRPLKLGVVPVYFGSPSIADWLPSNKSAILVTRFSHPRELAQYIKALDTNDQEYVAYLEWKLKGDISNKRLLTAMKERKWGVQDITQDNYIDVFECMVCHKVWENIRRQEKGFLPRRWNAEVNHLSCPKPQAFLFSSPNVHRASLRDMWIPSFEQSKKEAQALRLLVERNMNFSAQEFWTLVFKE
ncbi:alpha-(1,3)-fucosyltransferase 10 [Alligator mississippiensis]|uniref:GDP-fucose protein O-fucosyltransferase n=1 Tax=Alligator mississippiensis TaxID=8496 RepID=A0A151NE42_ALLMI|nr:alpha-(1,3)-fucosyltransferase 10 [Alligator mississippiensis]KYO35083.1 alpha-(1,3)-fucosyltransferase 10 [Alligator mississippiensis]